MATRRDDLKHATTPAYVRVCLQRVPRVAAHQDGQDALNRGDPGMPKLMTHGGPGNAELGTDLAQATTLAVHVGYTLNVHGATVTSLSRIGLNDSDERVLLNR